jgi:oligogalacturonide lyase
MSKGTIYPSESKSCRDVRTGASIRQITDHQSINHHPFFLIPAYDDRMDFLFFVSYRTGTPQICCEVGHGGHLLQLTDRPDISEWSVSPSRDGKWVYYTASAGAWRVNVESLEEQELVNFGSAEMSEKGMVGAAMGTTALSYDNKWWAVPVKIGDITRLVIVNTENGESEVILERDSIGHPEFHPNDSSILHYAGPYHNRMWVINRDGTENRLVYERNAITKQWVVHEAWLPGTRELTVVNWPKGMLAVNVDTGAVRRVCTFNAWHAISNRQGTVMVADTTYPDIGLQLFDPNNMEIPPRTLCYPEAWNLGAHWHTDHCPYDDDDYKQGKWSVYAPQHTHPHPSFSPDGKRVVYTSDRTGFSQVYEVQLAGE